MKLFAAIGIAVSALAVAGMFGIGHFRLFYSQEPIVCNAAPKASHDPR